MADNGAYGGGGGFKNIDPRSRDKRSAQFDHDMMMKQRIAARAGNQMGAPYDPVRNPVMPVHNSPQYVDEGQRFAGSAAAEEAARKHGNIARKEAIYDRNRADNYYRDKARWDHMEANAQRQEAHLQQARDTGMGARSNKPSEHYNILTLDYAKDNEGQKLQFKDETSHYKAQMRAHTLYTKGHSVSHNIITGEMRQVPIPMPQRPVAPWEK